MGFINLGETHTNISAWPRYFNPDRTLVRP